MSDKFLGSGGGSINLSNGSATIFSATLGCASLDPSRPIKTNSVKQLISADLDIADVNTLSTQLTEKDELTFVEDDTHTTPATGKVKIYAKTDSKLYKKNDQGVESVIGGGGGGSINAESTGIISGGVISVGTGGLGVATTFSITDGVGQIISDDPLGTGNVTSENVVFTNITDVPLTNIATDLITFVSIGSGPTIIQSSTRPTPTERRTNIFLGVVVHVNKTVVDAINNQQDYVVRALGQFRDFVDIVGFLNVSGNILSDTGSGLTIQKSAGKIYATGSNYSTNPQSPNIKSLNLIDTSAGGTFQYRMSDGTNTVPDNTTVSPTLWENPLGTLATVGNNKFTIIRFYSFTSNNLKALYGQEEFSSLEQARAAVQSGNNFLTEPSILANGLLIGYLIVKNNVLNLTTALASGDAVFINSGKFGSITSSSSSALTLQNAYDNSGTNPKIITPDGTSTGLTIERAVPQTASLPVLLINGTDGFEALSVGSGNLLVSSGRVGVLSASSILDGGAGNFRDLVARTAGSTVRIDASSATATALDIVSGNIRVNNGNIRCDANGFSNTLILNDNNNTTQADSIGYLEVRGSNGGTNMIVGTDGTSGECNISSYSNVNDLVFSSNASYGRKTAKLKVDGSFEINDGQLIIDKASGESKILLQTGTAAGDHARIYVDRSSIVNDSVIAHSEGGGSIIWKAGMLGGTSEDYVIRNDVSGNNMITFDKLSSGGQTNSVGSWYFNQPSIFPASYYQRLMIDFGTLYNVIRSEGNTQGGLARLDIDASEINVQSHILTNQTVFDNDQQLATKKYVDDTAGGGGSTVIDGYTFNSFSNAQGPNATASYTWYFADKAPTALKINTITLFIRAGGSSTIRVALFSGSSIGGGLLLGQSAEIGSLSSDSYVDFPLGNTVNISKGEVFTLAVAIGGTTTSIQGSTVYSGTDLLSWFNSTDLATPGFGTVGVSTMQSKTGNQSWRAVSVFT